MNKKQVLAEVKKSIKKLEIKFRNNHDYFMDMKELDLTAYLYHLIASEKISKKYFFLREVDVKYENDKRNYKTKILQVESSTYKEVKVRKGRFDLTIYDPDKLSDAYCETEQSYFIAIELKWIGSLDSKTSIKDIKKDIKQKINKDENLVEHGFLLIFNKDEKFTKKFKDRIRGYNKNRRKLTIRFINAKKIEK